jgi:hypothetical protein
MENAPLGASAASPDPQQRGSRPAPAPRTTTCKVDVPGCRLSNCVHLDLLAVAPDRSQPHARSAHRRRGDVISEPNQLTLDTPMTPARVLRGHPDHQPSDRRRSRWVSRPAPGETIIPCRRSARSPQVTPRAQFWNPRGKGEPSVPVPHGDGSHRPGPRSGRGPGRRRLAH